MNISEINAFLNADPPEPAENEFCYFYINDGVKCWSVNAGANKKYKRFQYSNGLEYWTLNYQYHCITGPAGRDQQDNKYWYLNGILYCSTNQSKSDFCKGYIKWLDAVLAIDKTK